MSMYLDQVVEFSRIFVVAFGPFRYQVPNGKSKIRNSYLCFSVCKV